MMILKLIILLVKLICFQYITEVSSGFERYLKHPDAKDPIQHNLPDILRAGAHPYQVWEHYGRDIYAMNEDINHMTRVLYAIDNPLIKNEYRKLIQDLKGNLIGILQEQKNHINKPLSKDRARYIAGSQVKKGQKLLKNMGIDLKDEHEKMICTLAPSKRRFLSDLEKEKSVLYLFEDEADKVYTDKKRSNLDRKLEQERCQRISRHIAEVLNDENLVKNWNLPPYQLEPYKAQDKWERRKLEEIEQRRKGKAKIEE